MHFLNSYIARGIGYIAIYCILTLNLTGGLTEVDIMHDRRPVMHDIHL